MAESHNTNTLIRHGKYLKRFFQQLNMYNTFLLIDCDTGHTDLPSTITHTIYLVIHYIIHMGLLMLRGWCILRRYVHPRSRHAELCLHLIWLPCYPNIPNFVVGGARGAENCSYIWSCLLFLS